MWPHCISFMKFAMCVGGESEGLGYTCKFIKIDRVVIFIATILMIRSNYKIIPLIAVNYAASARRAWLNSFFQGGIPESRFVLF